MRFSKSTRRLCIPATAAVLLLTACGEENKYVAPPPPKVTVARPEMRQVVDYDRYNGWLQPVETVDIRARVRGHLQKVLLTDGDLVQDGTEAGVANALGDTGPGFQRDSDNATTFQRQVDFIKKSGIVTAMVGMLQAPPGTKLAQRLRTEGRLLGQSTGDNTDGTTNIVPTMGLEALREGRPAPWQAPAARPS